MPPSRVALPLALAALLLAPGAAWAASPPGRAALGRALDEALSREPLASARVGVCVVSLDTGQTVYQRDADVLLNPASNVKLFTSAAALARLGPAWRFTTEALVDPADAGRPSVRTLYLRGTGDPTLVTERLYALAADLFHLGLRRVGDLVLDDTWFDGVRVGPGYDQEDGDRAYLAPTGALSLNFNSVAIHVAPGDRAGRPGRVELEPASRYFELVNRTRTVGRRARRRITTSSELVRGRQRITVEGRLPVGGRHVAVWRKIDDPPRYLGETLRLLLERQGVRVTGSIRAGRVPEAARLLHAASSQPLGEVVRTLNKGSQNFVAEQLLKALGAETAGPPGTFASGVAAVEAFLAEVGIARGAYVMKNGSGLNDANRFSARQAVTLLEAMWRRFPVAAEFLASLPVAGRDGTVRYRLEGTAAEGRLRAKTGTLDGVTALSGYLEGDGGERLAFAVLVNDHPGLNGPATQAVDELAALLAGRPPAPAPAPPAEPEADLAARLATYTRLARAADPRNVAFLRTALRSEREPSLRLGAAEALYRSDPDGEGTRRAFLLAVAEALPAGAEPAALARVVAAGDAETPAVLGALGDLAAEGGAEPMARLVALAPTCAAAPLLEPYAAALQEVGASAPHELLVALSATPPGDRDAPLAALLAGLSGAPPDHPLLARARELARLGGAEPPPGAEGARALLARLAAP